MHIQTDTWFKTCLLKIRHIYKHNVQSAWTAVFSLTRFSLKKFPWQAVFSLALPNGGAPCTPNCTTHSPMKVVACNKLINGCTCSHITNSLWQGKSKSQSYITHPLHWWGHLILSTRLTGLKGLKPTKGFSSPKIYFNIKNCPRCYKYMEGKKVFEINLAFVAGKQNAEQHTRKNKAPEMKIILFFFISWEFRFNTAEFLCQSSFSPGWGFSAVQSSVLGLYDFRLHINIQAMLWRSRRLVTVNRL